MRSIPMPGKLEVKSSKTAVQYNSPAFTLVFWMLLSFVFVEQTAICGDKNSPPNIIVILADDLGYGDVSCYGATEVSTPNIDRLAREGARFTSGYCSAATCTPTRFSLLTGMYAFRQPGTGIAPPNATALIQPGTETLPSMLKQAGYATAVIGKWHLGLGAKPAPDWNGELKPGPREIGFDYCYLLPTTNDRVPQVYVENHRVVNLDPADPLWVGMKNPNNQPTGITARETLRMDWSHGHNNTIHNGIGRIGFYTGGHKARFRDEDLADQWVKKSVEWIEAHQEKPFFLFFSSHDIHVPRMPHERFQGKTSLGYRGDAIVELDWSVGQLTKTVQRLGLTENTLIIFCSDNGPVLDDGYKDGAVEKLGKHLPSGPFRGGKYSAYEGGTRTPFITWWPGKIAPGISDEMINTIDLPATLAQLTKQTISDNAFPDSFDMLDVLLKQPNAVGRKYVVEQGIRSLGLRHGDWKLVEFKQGRKKWAKNKKIKPNKSKYELYNLKEDIGEKNNLFNKYPEKARQMVEQLKQIKANRTRVK